jgi:L-aspartate oxidase
LATGGAGALWQYTTNPLGSWGHGLVLAAKAGAQLADLEFMQFHPTAIDCGRDPMPLASEALRGEGATIVDEKGDRILANLSRGELEPRDVIAKTIFAHAAAGHKIFLDLRHLEKILNSKFPAIVALCHENGLDPLRSPIPIRPAAHYHMGGVWTDGDGKTSLEGLWACGEVASTGLHGANRLASNSLLEAASIGHRVALALKGRTPRLVTIHQPTIPPFNASKNHEADIDTLRLRQLFSTHVGVLRHHDGLLEARRMLTPLAAHSDRALISLMIATAAFQRTESRGAQTRLDFPKYSPQWDQRQILTLNDVIKENAAFLTPTPMIA